MPEFLSEYFTSLAESIASTLQRPDAYLNKISLTAIIALIGLSLHILIKKMITHNVSDFKKRYRLHKVFKQMIATLTIISVLFIWVQAINALILLALLFGVFIVFMVRGLTANIIAYFVIKYHQYFAVGNRIEINNMIGDVIEINPIHVKLLEVRNTLSSDANTGRVIKLPNSIIFNESIKMSGVKNDFVWHEIKNIFSFDSDWQEAERIMKDAGTAYFEECIVPTFLGGDGGFLDKKEKLRPVFSVDTNDMGIVLILRYVVDYKNGTSAKTYLQRRMLAEFRKNPQIKFATVDIRILPE
ncbi:hypothetical protein DV702_10910 [Sporosarcina sp. PTS2304]|uniref:mechanosensitive ion channel domain-containing protein n=1 Tax=Sporosarcina sp. PTS2304 TaxID=2283194 RepID=UPI000E0CF859|nr:mechanosensitive ion channel domain-containing protein [Sporosarcina sp. PTS2304]AXI00185.1 hypothetical protein DV702_10910 [Sporosarcina sp. PTS2304]